MPGAGRSDYSTIETPQAPERRVSLSSLRKLPLGTWDRDESPFASIPDRFWVFWVAVVTLPSLIFGLMCAFFLPEDFAEFLDLGSVGTLVAAGFLGAGTTLAAFVITMIATLQARTTRKTRIALWTLVVSSLACWLYIWICFSADHQVPPHIPMIM
jgi:nitrate/nitrite transporter NarK